MTTTIVEKLLSEAKDLTIRLKNRDAMTDKVISKTFGVQQKLNAMKQYQEIIDRLNKAASHRPKEVLIQKLNKMNSKIEELKRDNSELQQSLEEHHEMLELIMSKFKQQSRKLASTAVLEATTPATSHFLKDAETKNSKIREMVSVMMVASERWGRDEAVAAEQQRLISLLQQKNQLMRMLLLNTPDHLLEGLPTDLQLTDPPSNHILEGPSSHLHLTDPQPDHLLNHDSSPFNNDLADATMVRTVSPDSNSTLSNDIHSLLHESSAVSMAT